MIKDAVLTLGTILYKSYIDVQEYYIISIKEDLITVKKIDDISCFAVPVFEMKTDIWHLTYEDAKNQLSIVNKREGVSIDNKIYNRDFRLSSKDIQEGAIFYEAFFGKSAFIHSVEQFGIIELTVTKFFKSEDPKYEGLFIVGLHGIQLNIPNAVPETFSVLLGSVLAAKNLFKNQGEILADMVRTGNTLLYDIRTMYDPNRELYKTLSEYEKEQIAKYIIHYKYNADMLDIMYNDYIARNKKVETSTKAERDTLNILKTIDK